MDLVTSVPRMSQEDFESILNSNMQVREILCTWDITPFIMANTIHNL